jgi:tRNA nucleotidyltransferase (CCA-adding enzyme)
MAARDLTKEMEALMPDGAVEALRALGRVADRRGSAALVVGGVVRDILLGKAALDLDVVVSEPAPEFGRAAAAELGGAVRAVTRFGTALLVLPGGLKVDLATARSESYERPGALPTVAGGTLADDLLRRDFTLNALAVVINGSGFGTLVDHHGGLADLERGVLRVLTDRSFEDDPTRILRAVRLSARLGFALDGHTEELLVRAVAAGCLSTVTGERILNEIVLILSEEDPWPPAARLHDWGILRAIDAAWTAEPDRGAFSEVSRALRPATGGPGAADAEPWVTYLVSLLAGTAPEDRDRVLARLAAPGWARRAARDATALEGLADGRLGAPGDIRRSEVRRLLAPFAPEALVAAMASRPDAEAGRRIALFLSELRHAVTELRGTDVEALGVPRGPAVGRVLGTILDARLDGEVTSRAEEEALARRLARVLDTGNKAC